MSTEQWHQIGSSLQDELREYDRNYRLKICSKCSLEQQKQRNCFRTDDFEIIHGKKIQFTHCKWMDKARVRKFRNQIHAFMNLGFRRFDKR